MNLDICSKQLEAQ